MSRLRVVVVVGTRPEVIKMAPVYLAMKRNPHIEPFLLATAQQRELLDQALAVFEIFPDVDLDLMCPNQQLSTTAARVIVSVQEVLADIHADVVLVHGDTTTCLYSALAAFYERIPVGHVEAGLRTYNFDAPWPEEMNRRLTDPISRWCFAPTTQAADNLRVERIPEENIFVTGNTVIDSLHLALEKTRLNPPRIPGISKEWMDGNRLIVVTGHRRESFGKPFEEFCLALRDVVRAHRDTVLVYPVHLNPNVQRPVNKILSGEKRVRLIPPVDYLPFVHLMDMSYIIITDSGGIQEEAPSLSKPVIVTRETTERPETVEAGLSQLVGVDRKTITREVSRLLSDRRAYEKMTHISNPYGDGRAAERIVNILLSTT